MNYEKRKERKEKKESLIYRKQRIKVKRRTTDLKEMTERVNIERASIKQIVHKIIMRWRWRNRHCNTTTYFYVQKVKIRGRNSL